MFIKYNYLYLQYTNKQKQNIMRTREELQQELKEVRAILEKEIKNRPIGKYSQEPIDDLKLCIEELENEILYCN